MRNKLDVEEIIKKLSVKEKAMFITGSSPMNNYGIKRLNIPSLNLNDGPNGIRRLKEGGDSLNGITNTLKSDLIYNQVSINSNETINYTMNFTSNDTQNYSGVIKIGLRTNEENSFADVILTNNNISNATITPYGESATLDEGLLESPRCPRVSRRPQRKDRA